MKNYNWVNYLSLFLIVCCISAWYYFLPNFISASDLGDDQSKDVHVEGVSAQNDENSKPESGENAQQALKNSTSEKLFEAEIDVPEKKEGFGDTYARARSAIAIDANSGTILHYQDGKRKMAIASLTKIMTAIIVVEKIEDLEKEVVTISRESVLTDGTKVGCPRSGYCISTRLQLGEKVTAKNLFDAMLMNSANDAASALGIHIAGSNEAFAQMMNEKAKELGLKDSNFCNPSGLDDDENPGACYSTAYDFARITAHSLKYDEIWKSMRIKEKDFHSVDGRFTHHLINTDILLDQLPNCLGGKTGFTYEAGRSLMTVAHHPANKDQKVIAVLLDDNYRWEDMKNLFSWVFSAYIWPSS